MSFVKYMHLERLGTEEVEGIEVGEVYIFPKLDGTNASAWVNISVAGGYELFGGSRNRVLSTENDNAGFYNWLVGSNTTSWNIYQFLCKNPNLILYGEWLVPHTLKTYRDDAWRRFYVFDVMNRGTGQLLHYNDWSPVIKEAGIDYLAPIAIIRNPSHDDLHKCLDKNVFLIKEGMGVGEGVVCKNYDFVNKYGRTVWAKIITNVFKEEHHKVMGAPIIGGSLVEEDIVNGYVTQYLVDKVYAKIVNEHGGWSSRYIPMLINMVYYDLITEEMWDILKKHKQPRIDFKMLQRLTVSKTKELKQELF
jgi:hypothetical protein